MIHIKESYYSFIVFSISQESEEYWITSIAIPKEKILKCKKCKSCDILNFFQKRLRFFDCEIYNRMEGNGEYDITDRKKMEEALKYIDSKHSEILYYQKDLAKIKGCLILFNNSLRKINDYQKDLTKIKEKIKQQYKGIINNEGNYL